jgi:hypothetical protein
MTRRFTTSEWNGSWHYLHGGGGKYLAVENKICCIIDGFSTDFANAGECSSSYTATPTYERRWTLYQTDAIEQLAMSIRLLLGHCAFPGCWGDVKSSTDLSFYPSTMASFFGTIENTRYITLLTSATLMSTYSCIREINLRASWNDCLFKSETVTGRVFSLHDILLTQSSVDQSRI